MCVASLTAVIGREKKKSLRLPEGGVISEESFYKDHFVPPHKNYTYKIFFNYGECMVKFPQGREVVGSPYIYPTKPC